jgi:hypothetical protein
MIIITVSFITLFVNFQFQYTFLKYFTIKIRAGTTDSVRDGVRSGLLGLT